MNLEKLLEQINTEIDRINFGQNPVELYEPIRYLMNLGGKRLRPVLTVLGASLFMDNPAKSILPAIGVEVFHNFTLMHDDIMDNAPLRRGKPTVHEKWNPNIAILSGDVMLVRAYELLTLVEDRHLRAVLRSFSQCAAEVCEGQQWDMNFENRTEVSEAEYIEMIRLKTAVLLGFGLELGGIIADAPLPQTQLLKAIGENLGIGFQLKDDLLDVYGDSNKFGKQVGGDIIANKKTFLLIEAKLRATGALATELNEWLLKKDFDKIEKVSAVTDIYNQLQIRDLTEQKIQTYFQKAYQLLSQIEAEANKKAELKAFTDWLIARES
jgi:geranylgeranyl diphosphate synthase type II